MDLRTIPENVDPVVQIRRAFALAHPVHWALRRYAACELLGLDPLYVANEGKLVAIVGPGEADAVVERMRRSTRGCTPRSSVS